MCTAQALPARGRKIQTEEQDTGLFWWQIDSKKELEKLLKATCEVFIMAVTKLTVEPMLSFITKVTAVRVASSLNPGRRLREQVCSQTLSMTLNMHP